MKKWITLLAFAAFSQGVSATTIQGQNFTIENIDSSYGYSLNGDKLSFAINYYSPGKHPGSHNWETIKAASFQLRVAEGYELKSISIGLSGVGTLSGSGSSGYWGDAWNLITWNYWEQYQDEEPYISQAGIYHPVDISSSYSSSSIINVIDIAASQYVTTSNTPPIDNLFRFYGDYRLNAGLGATLQVDSLYWTFEVVPVPEPSAYAMLGLGLGLVGFAARRRKTS